MYLDKQETEFGDIHRPYDTAIDGIIHSIDRFIGVIGIHITVRIDCEQSLPSDCGYVPQAELRKMHKAILHEMNPVVRAPHISRRNSGQSTSDCTRDILMP